MISSVLIVDDSAVFRNFLRRGIESDPSMRVIGEAKDGAEAVELSLRLKPNVITMDITMPVTDGIEAIKQIMRNDPRPIVVVSGTLDSSEVDQAFEAMEAGAVAVVPKPSSAEASSLSRSLEEIVTTVRLMGEVKVVKRRRFDTKTPSAPVITRPVTAGIVAIGASTGGPAALELILRDLPAELPVPVVIVQHIAAGFEQGLVNWLQRISPLKIKLASEYHRLVPGEVVISRSGQHLIVSRHAAMTRDGEPVDGHRPSATNLFSSVASAWGAEGVGVILTGMGKDGTKGLVELKKAGGYVLGQDEATSIVYGMPKEAKQAGVVDQVLPLSEIATAIVQLCGDGSPT